MKAPSAGSPRELFFINISSISEFFVYEDYFHPVVQAL